MKAASLYQLLNEAYESHNVDDSSQKPLFYEFKQQKMEEQPKFRFWIQVLELELDVLQYMRSIREENFELYIQMLGKLVPWFFSMGHTHYVRWVPVHIWDMLLLQERYADVHRELMIGKFVITKTLNLFSKMAIDQAHEQENEKVKGEGGAVDITEVPAALLRWMVAGPEVARVVHEFMAHQEDILNGKENLHHDQSPSIQRAFYLDVKSNSECMRDMGNPFTEETGELVALDTKQLMSEDVVNRMDSIHAEGEKYYKEFVADVLYHHNKPISSPIHRQNHTIFRDNSSSKSKSKQKMSDLKQNVQLLGRMYISCVARGGDVKDFMKHENLSHPPALAEGGELRGGTKAEILPCLYPDYKPTLSPQSPNMTCLVVDGPAFIHHCPPGKSKTSQDYSRLCFLPQVLSTLYNIKRLDIIWDRFLPDSLKSSSREKQGRGIRIQVLPPTLRPSNFKKFLLVADNKVRLFAHLAGQLAQLLVEGKLIITTIDNTAITSLQIPYPADMITLCNHEEADSRLLLQAAHCLATVHKQIMVTTTDSDVVLLAIFAAAALNPLYKLEKLWVEFIVGKKRCYILAYELASMMGAEKTRAMPIFHAITGCDTTSEFKGKKKNTAWETWNAFPEVTQAFLSLMDKRELSRDNFNII